jgi:hypothetical protein
MRHELTAFTFTFTACAILGASLGSGGCASDVPAEVSEQDRLRDLLRDAPGRRNADLKAVVCDDSLAPGAQTRLRKGIQRVH